MKRLYYKLMMEIWYRIGNHKKFWKYYIKVMENL